MVEVLHGQAPQVWLQMRWSHEVQKRLLGKGPARPQEEQLGPPEDRRSPVGDFVDMGHQGPDLSFPTNVFLGTHQLLAEVRGVVDESVVRPGNPTQKKKKKKKKHQLQQRGPITLLPTFFKPILPIAHKSARIDKISILKLEGIIKKISYERRDYKSVDEKKPI